VKTPIFLKMTNYEKRRFA